MSADGFRRVTPRHPCPVCGRRSWCRVSADGRVTLCNVVESPQRERGRGGAWVHRLTGTGSESYPPRPTLTPPATTPKLSAAELNLIDRKCRTAITTTRLTTLADRLAVSAATLVACGIGWHSELVAYSPNVAWLHYDMVSPEDMTTAIERARDAKKRG